MAILARRQHRRSTRLLRKALMVVFALALSTLLIAAGPANAQRGAELDDLKAAFVYQFTKFVEWPEDAFESRDAPLVICIVGNDRMRETLKASIEGKSAKGHPLKVTDAHEKNGACHILFVDSSQGSETPEILDKFMTEPVLTVSDSKDFTKNGGIIRLYQEKSKLRIEINVDAAKRAKLDISSKLLRLARVVQDK